MVGVSAAVQVIRRNLPLLTKRRNTKPIKSESNARASLDYWAFSARTTPNLFGLQIDYLTIPVAVFIRSVISTFSPCTSFSVNYGQFAVCSTTEHS
eukprot:1399619-Pyramimonas_sp.AAC.6